MVGWGIVGTGRVADASVSPALADVEEAKVVGAVGTSPAKAREFADKHGGRGYDTFEEMLADDAVQVVYIATPNAVHAGQVVAAARAGKHVFADKPLATSVEDARRAVEACANAGVKLGVNFQTRHHEGMDVVADTVRNGGVGEVKIVQCEVGSGVGSLSGWRADPETTGGLGTINNQGVHAYDLLRYLLGAEIEEVAVLTDVGRRDELETIGLALFRFESGALAYVNANQAVPNFQPDIVIYGSTGTIVGRSVTRPFLERGSFTITTSDGQRTIETQSKDAFRRSVAAFNDAVRNDEEPNASGVDGLRSVELTAAMMRSAREARIVRVGE